VSSDDTIAQALTVDGAERDTDLDEVMSPRHELLTPSS